MIRLLGQSRAIAAHIRPSGGRDSGPCLDAAPVSSFSLMRRAAFSRRSMLIDAAGLVAATTVTDTALAETPATDGAVSQPATAKENLIMADKAEDPTITRARLSRPKEVTADATIAELHHDGSMTILVQETNAWVCVPGDENTIGEPPMRMNPMGLRWMMDAVQAEPKPTNAAPGMIYMLCSAPQRSTTDPSDRTSARHPDRTPLD